MRVFLAGATGAIGQRLVPQLLAAGHEVVATTRTPAKVEQLACQGATPVVVDGLDRAAVIAAVCEAGPDAIVHEMTALAGAGSLRRFDRAFRVTNELRTRGLDHLLAAARAGGVRRVVAQSFTGWPNERSGGPVKSEDDPLDPRPPRSMRETLAALRYLERTLGEARDLEGVALRYGALYGPGTAMEHEYVELIRRGRLPIVGDGGGIWSLVHVDDAAAATVRALDHGAPGAYNIVDDDPAPVREWLPYLAAQLGAPPPRRVPLLVGRLAAGSAGVSLMTRIRGSSNAKAKRELGWEPRYASWRDGFRRGV